MNCLRTQLCCQALEAEASQRHRDVIRQCMTTLVPAIDKATETVICMPVATRSSACVVDNSEAAERAKMMYHPDKEHRMDYP